MGPPFSSVGHLAEQKQFQLASDESIDADRDERADREREEIQVDLTARVEGGECQPAGEAAEERRRDDFSDDEGSAAGTAMPVCKVALAVGTCCQESSI
jgi:hypothetical protein